MKSLRILITIWLMIAPGLCLGADLSNSKRVALVIGNSKYAKEMLVNPVNDARDMATALGNLGFEVILKLDQDRKAMHLSIREFGERLGKDSVGLFYYAGHGIQVNRVNYLIPINADIKNPDEVKDEAVDAELVLRKMETAGNPMNLMILDACRDNPFERSWRRGSEEKGLASMSAPGGVIILYSTRLGQTADDGKGKNSPFTKQLLSQISVEGLEVMHIIQGIASGLEQDTGGKQSPWMEGIPKAHFYFKPGKNLEDQMWGMVKDSDDVSDVEKFLESYPNGKYAHIAKLKVSQLKRVQEKKVVATVETTTETVVPKTEQTEIVQEQPAAKTPKYRLRSEPITTETESALTSVKDVKNEFEDNKDGTITDHATGLMWQKSGSPNYLYLKDMPAYIEKLNREKFAGYSDWRLPTVDELKSLITKEKQSDDPYINPIFDKTQSWCWTSDKRASGGAWYVSFLSGLVYWYMIDNNLYVRAVRSVK